MSTENLSRWLRSIGGVALSRRLIHRRGLITVLCLHRVMPTEDPLYPRLTPDQLRALCRYLKPRYRIVRFCDLRRDSMKRSPHPLLILSFDDAYRDFFENAMPVLLEEGIRANLNVVTACADTGHPYPWQDCLDVLNSAPDGLLQATLRSLGAGGLGGGEDRLQVGLAFTAWFQELSPETLQEVLTRLNLARTMRRFEATKMMTWSEIREADRLGFEIGSHSVSHASLDRLSQDRLEAEIVGSKVTLERELGHPVDVFAFPAGRMNQNAVQTAEQAGYRHVLGVGEALNDYHNRGAWNRILLYGRSLDRLIVRASGLETSLRRRTPFRQAGWALGIEPGRKAPFQV